MFSWFLSEEWSNDDLLFFLLVRSMAAKVMNIASLKLRLATMKTPYTGITVPQCVSVAKLVYGQKYPDMHRMLLTQVQCIHTRLIHDH